MAKTPRVLMKGLKKKFGSIVAVDDLTLEAEDQKLTVLLGPSGCGKTTALRCIAGLEEPDEGEIYIGDTLVTKLPPQKRDAAMVFQSYALYPNMTVFENLAFTLKIRKFPQTEIKRKVKETAELIRISHVLNRRPSELSGGEAQRVALGRALVREPKVFLMDEPLSNLDAKLRLYMRAELKRLQKELKVTTIYVTHDQAEAMTLADTIAVMNQGQLQQVDSPGLVYSKPANSFIAGFIGSPPMNLLDCTLTEKNERGTFCSGGFEYTPHAQLTQMIRSRTQESELILGVRPEDISIHKTRSGPNSIASEVYVVEPLGFELIVDVKLAEHIVKVRTPPTMQLQIGEKVWLTFNEDRIHFFDRKSEKAII